MLRIRKFIVVKDNAGDLSENVVEEQRMNFNKTAPIKKTNYWNYLECRKKLQNLIEVSLEAIVLEN